MKTYQQVHEGISDAITAVLVRGFETEKDRVVGGYPWVAQAPVSWVYGHVISTLRQEAPAAVDRMLDTLSRMSIADLQSLFQDHHRKNGVVHPDYDLVDRPDWLGDKP